MYYEQNDDTSGRCTEGRIGGKGHFINMQMRYNMSAARQKKPLIARLMDIKRACAAVF